MTVDVKKTINICDVSIVPDMVEPEVWSWNPVIPGIILDMVAEAAMLIDMLDMSILTSLSMLVLSCRVVRLTVVDEYSWAGGWIARVP